MQPHISTQGTINLKTILRVLHFNPQINESIWKYWFKSEMSKIKLKCGYVNIEAKNWKMRWLSKFMGQFTASGWTCATQILFSKQRLCHIFICWLQLKSWRHVIQEMKKDKETLSIFEVKHTYINDQLHLKRKLSKLIDLHGKIIEMVRPLTQ